MLYVGIIVDFVFKIIGKGRIIEYNIKSSKLLYCHIYYLHNDIDILMNCKFI